MQWLKKLNYSVHVRYLRIISKYCFDCLFNYMDIFERLSFQKLSDGARNLKYQNKFQTHY